MNDDKFVYKDENELTIVESQCELCNNYNNGNYSDKCPKEFFEQIKANEMKCPNKEKDDLFARFSNDNN